MKRIVMASMREGAGKTSLIAGIAAATGKRCGYIKPLGDRLVYKRKKNVDHDAMVLLKFFKIDQEPDFLSLGFAHSKLRYRYDEKGAREALVGLAESAGAGRDVLFVEGGRDLAWGSSVYLDSLSVARALEARLILVIGGDADLVMDDITFARRSVDLAGVDFGGVIFNKIQDVDDFKGAGLGAVTGMGVPVIGVVPFKQQLTCFTMNFLADRFVARVIAGEGGLGNVVKSIFVGAMSTDESLRNPLFNKENKLLITSGDRSDMIIAALESDTVGIILTNNIVPPPNIISAASAKNIPVLLLPHDTYEVARQMDNFDALLTAEGDDRVALLGQLVKDYVSVGEIA